MLEISWLKYFTDTEADARCQAEERGALSSQTEFDKKKTLTHTHFNKPTSVRLCVSAAEGRVGGLGCHSHDVRNPPACVNERGVLAKSRFFAVPYHFEEVCMQWQSSFLKKSLMFF